VNAWTITKPLAVASASAAVVTAALLAFFAFGATPVEAQPSTIKVNPIDVELGDLAEGEVKTTTITLTNQSDEIVEVGEIDLELLEGEGVLEDLDLSLLDLDGNELVDLSILNALPLDQLLDGLLDLDLLGIDPIELDPNETVQLVLEILPVDPLPNETGDINLTVELLNGGTTIAPVVQVGGQAQRCTIEGGPGPDTLPGTTGPDVICGRGGNDIITDPGGNDIIFAGEGSDQADAGPGKDKVYGGTGNPGTAAESTDADVLNGEGGRDRLDAKDGEPNDTLRGGPGKDKLVKDKGDSKS
jgi:Ca2+-binding RTX toxin-like protein